MLIDKNWFYNLNLDIDDEIIISKGVIVSIFYWWSKNIKFYLGEGASLEFFSYFSNEQKNQFEFFQDENNSNLKIRSLIFSKENFIKTKIYSKISSNNSSSDIKILSLVSDNWNIDLDWIVEIDSWYKKIKGHLVEKNLFLWNTWKIKWIPTLLVRSDDVEASHSCTIEKISNDELFYLRSRWINKWSALTLIIASKINSVFSCLLMYDKNFYDELLEKISTEINIK